MPRALQSNSSAPRVWNLEAHQQNADQHFLVQMAGINTVPPAPVVEEVWKTTPFSGDFNLVNKPGNSIFIEKTKGLPESLRLHLIRIIHRRFTSIFELAKL